MSREYFSICIFYLYFSTTPKTKIIVYTPKYKTISTKEAILKTWCFSSEDIAYETREFFIVNRKVNRPFQKIPSGLFLLEIQLLNFYYK